MRPALFMTLPSARPPRLPETRQWFSSLMPTVNAVYDQANVGAELQLAIRLLLDDEDQRTPKATRRSPVRPRPSNVARRTRS